MKTIGFFSSKGGIGKTTLVYHLAWMFQELGVDVIAMDLDPQADLTAAFVSEDQMFAFVTPKDPLTITGALERVIWSNGEIQEPVLQDISEHLSLLPGNPELDFFERRLAYSWLNKQDANAFNLTTSFTQVALRAARIKKAQVGLIDLRPGLSAINRAALVACDAFVVPLSTDSYSLWGLPPLGVSLREWQSTWREWEQRQTAAPPGACRNMGPIGYVVLQHSARMERQLDENQNSIDSLYRRSIVGIPEDTPISDPDRYRLAILKPYRSLMPLAQDARKPMFLLKPADGAIGSHVEAVRDCYRDFKQLALRIASACGVAIPS